MHILWQTIHHTLSSWPTSLSLCRTTTPASASWPTALTAPSGGACKDGQWVVVKALQPPYRGCAQYEMSLRKEYDILSMFDSPYVVKVYSYGDVAGYGSCIVMEWIDGVTLKE